MKPNFKLIFFHPAKIELGASGSSVRPYHMLKAFQSLGISVEEVSGNRSTREAKIEQLKKRILSGEQFDLLYVENTTLPLELQLIRTKFLSFYTPYSNDKKFIQFCLDQNIPCSYYYRDIHWDFPEAFENNHSFLKKIYVLLFQRYFGKKELAFLRKDIQLYVPSELFKAYLKDHYQLQAKTLSPGSTIQSNSVVPKTDQLTLIYVGGISPLYFSDYLINELSKIQSNIKIIICCRKDEYVKNKERFSTIRQKEIHHASGDELIDLYKRAKIALFPLKPSGYGQLSYSIKIPEYICNAKPIIAFKNNTCASIIEKHQLGWTISEKENELADLIKTLVDQPEEIDEKIANALAVRDQFTWVEVAKKVIQDQ